jgi:cytoskeletal protein CcmA (bactofilin family)
MAVFNKSDGKTTRERPAVAPRAAGGDGAISIIGPGMRIEGDLATDGTVRVEGTIIGTIKAGKAVVLGQSGEVVGDIFTRDAVIGGRVKGTLVADSRLELQASCLVEGEIRARASHLQLEEGANFNGQIRMIDAEEAPEAVSPRRAAARPAPDTAPEPAPAPAEETS